MKIVVTGATGFVGSHLVPALRATGVDVTGVVRPGRVLPWPDVPLCSVDIVSGVGLEKAFDGADAVIHLAARNHVLREKDPDPLARYREVNVDGTLNVVRAAMRAGVPLVVCASSVKAVAEESSVLLDEESPCHPTTLYGISKLEAEAAATAEVAGSGTRLVILRFPMVYGPPGAGNLPRMIRWARAGRPFPVFLPDAIRSLLFVGNLTAALECVLQPSFEGRGVYFVSDGEDVTVRRLHELVCLSVGRPANLWPVPAPFSRLASFLSEDVRRLASPFRVDSSRFRRDAGFVPPFRVEEGVFATVKGTP